MRIVVILAVILDLARSTLAINVSSETHNYVPLEGAAADRCLPVAWFRGTFAELAPKMTLIGRHHSWSSLQPELAFEYYRSPVRPIFNRIIDRFLGQMASPIGRKLSDAIESKDDVDNPFVAKCRQQLQEFRSDRKVQEILNAKEMTVTLYYLASIQKSYINSNRGAWQVVVSARVVAADQPFLHPVYPPKDVHLRRAVEILARHATAATDLHVVDGDSITHRDIMLQFCTKYEANRYWPQPTPEPLDTPAALDDYRRRLRRFDASAASRLLDTARTVRFTVSDALLYNPHVDTRPEEYVYCVYVIGVDEDEKIQATDVATLTESDRSIGSRQSPPRVIAVHVPMTENVSLYYEPLKDYQLSGGIFVKFDYIKPNVRK